MGAARPPDISAFYRVSGSYLLLRFFKLYTNKKTGVAACFLVDPEGFEPSAFSMPLRRAPNCAMGPTETYIIHRN